jgi:hypothetical protein
MLLIWEHALSYILSQSHHAYMTQPLLLEQLHEWESDISVGPINALLTLGKEDFLGRRRNCCGLPLRPPASPRFPPYLPLSVSEPLLGYK